MSAAAMMAGTFVALTLIAGCQSQRWERRVWGTPEIAPPNERPPRERVPEVRASPDGKTIDVTFKDLRVPLPPPQYYGYQPVVFHTMLDVSPRRLSVKLTAKMIGTVYLGPDEWFDVIFSAGRGIPQTQHVTPAVKTFEISTESVEDGFMGWPKTGHWDRFPITVVFLVLAQDVATIPHGWIELKTVTLHVEPLKQ